MPATLLGFGDTKVNQLAGFSLSRSARTISQRETGN